MTTIEIRNRRDDFHAQIKGRPELWGCGSTELAAIGDLVKTHAYSFGFTVQTIANLHELTNEIAGLSISMDSKLYKIKIEKL